jgi:hypothetical protein
MGELGWNVNQMSGDFTSDPVNQRRIFKYVLVASSATSIARHSGKWLWLIP